MIAQPAKPLFIVFEGLDGSGKTTLARRCAEALGAIYMTTPTSEVREYRDSLIAALGPCQEARQLFYLATVFAASREITEQLAAGRSVVLDRYFLSTQAYAQFRGSQLALDDLAPLLQPADITIFVHASLATRRRRIAQRGASAGDRETLTEQADLRLRELHFTRRELGLIGEWLVIDNESEGLDRCVAMVQRECARVARA